MKLVYDNIKICGMCGNFTQDKLCEICSNNRDAKILCLVRDHTDLYSIESTRAYNGLYYILGGNFSPSSPNSTEIINKIRDRAINDKVEEVMLAFNPSIEGRMLLHYLSASLNDLSLKVTHLGLGIPIGADFDYMDKETMTAAIMCRRQV
jgi:recombination protein RecR